MCVCVCVTTKMCVHMFWMVQKMRLSAVSSYFILKMLRSTSAAYVSSSSALQQDGYSSVPSCLEAHIHRKTVIYICLVLFNQVF